MSGHSKWASIKRRGRHRCEAGPALFEAGTGNHRRGSGGGPDPPRISRSRTRSRRRGRPRCPRTTSSARLRGAPVRGRRRLVRNDHIRGLRTVRDRRLRRGSNRQSQPHRCRGTAHLHEERWEPRRVRIGRLAVRAARRGAGRRERRRGRAHSRGCRGRRRRHRARGRQLASGRCTGGAPAFVRRSRRRG